MSKITVTCFTWNEDDTIKVYEGDLDATVSTQGELIIVRNVPDVGNKNNGLPTRKVTAIYSKGSWDRVEIDE